MHTREELRRRADVPDADIEQIIEVAAELQDAEREAEARPTVAELEDVAAELDIEPRYVEEAIGRIQAQRAERERQAAQAAERRGRLLRGAGGIAAVVALLLAAMVVSGAVAQGRLAADRAAAEQALVVVLDRQASLAPQLVALAGGTADLQAEAEAVRAAEDLDARMAAVQELNTEMARALADLPAGSDATARDLHHELTGGWNRITVERRRLAEVEARQEAALRRPDVALAALLGF